MTLPSLHRPPRQRGVALVFAMVAMVATLIATALAIDIGRLYFTQRDLQREANLAALDAARVASGCLGEIDNRSVAAYNEVLASVLRNGGGESDLTGGGGVQVGRLVTGDDQVRRFVPAAGDNDYAVEVRLKRDAPARLIPLFSSASAPLQLRATAAAQSLPIASVSVGPSLVDANPTLLNDLLGQQLGGNLGVSVAGYGGLFSASANIGALALELGVGSASDLLTASVSINQFLNALANTLTATSDALVRSTLQTLAAASDASREVTPGEVVEVPPEFEEAAGGAVINVGAVVTALAQTANGDNLLTVPLAVNIPGVTGPGMALVSVIEPATPAVGPAGDGLTRAKNAVVNAFIDLPLLPILGQPARLKLYVQAAQATAELTEIECPHRGKPQPTVRVAARTNLVRLGIGEFDDINDPDAVPQPATLVSLNLLGQPIQIKIAAATDLGSPEAEELVYEGPFDGPQVQRIGVMPGGALSAAVGRLASSLVITVEPAGALLNPLLALTLNPLLSTLGATLAPVLARVDDSVLAPLLEPLGVTLGGADVIVDDVVTDQPYLFLR